MSRTLGMLNMTALLVGGAAFLEDERKNRRRSMRAEDKADEALRIAEEWAASGDKIRLQDPKVRDYLLGMSYPAQAAQESPSATATTPSVVERPYMSEDMATGPTEYPPAVNLYDSFGRLIHPSQAQDGENFLHGLVQNFSELRAADLGATFEGVPNAKKLAHVFRHHRGLMEAIAQLEAEGITLEEAREAWLRFYGSVGSKEIWVLNADTPKPTTLGDAIYTSFVLPKRFLSVGETLKVEWAVVLGGGAANEHYPFLTLDDVSGQRLWSISAAYDTNDVGAVGEHCGVCSVDITRRENDASGGNRFSVSGTFTAQDFACGGAYSGSTSLSFNHNVDQVISIGRRQTTIAMPSWAYRGTAKRR